MSFLLDTNICSAYLKGHSGLAHRFQQHGGRLYVPTVVVGELYTWAERRQKVAASILQIESDLLSQAIELPFDRPCAREFGKQRAALLARGRPMDSIDLQIAATALAHNLILVTHNTADFIHVPGLQLDDWPSP
jgi:tRNA(fMet)-specific endonuclease VapC